MCSQCYTLEQQQEPTNIFSSYRHGVVLMRNHKHKRQFTRSFIFPKPTIAVLVSQEILRDFFSSEMRTLTSHAQKVRQQVTKRGPATRHFLMDTPSIRTHQFERGLETSKH